MPEMKINTLARWFGSDCSIRLSIGRQLGKLAWCGVPFCGGCSALPLIQARSGLAGDLHRHVINLARVVRHPTLKAMLIDALDQRLFHPDEFTPAQRRCIEREAETSQLFGETKRDALSVPDVEWAADYFIACWMGRGGHAGKTTEFRQGLAIRFTASGGDSAVRFRNAVASMEAWHKAIREWQFICTDAFSFLDSVKDEPGHGLYIDAPWRGAGDEYKHKFTDGMHMRLQRFMKDREHLRIVIRYGDDPFIRELYPEKQWTWLCQTSRDQQNGEVNEALIINGPSYVEAEE